MKFTVRRKRSLPFEFALEALEGAQPMVKPMFGCWAIYLGEKIVLVLRERDSHRDDNGVWLATTLEHHESLKRDFLSMRSLKLFGKAPTAWQNIPADADDFEESVLKACQMILRGDLRIGKVPDRKRRSKRVVSRGSERRGKSRRRVRAKPKAKKTKQRGSP